MTIISKLQHVRGLLIAVVTTVVTACASLMPLQYRISKDDIETKIAAKVSNPKVFLQVFEARFARPSVDFLSDEQRIRMTLPVMVTERISSKFSDITAVFSARWEPTDEGRAVWLRDVRIEQFEAKNFQGVSALLQKALVLFVEPLLERLVVYKIPDKESDKFRIDQLKIDHNYLTIATRPNR